MSFASVIFLLFVPIVFGLHWFCANRHWQNAILLVASYVFYGWWDWRFCGLILATSLLDYFIAILIERTSVDSTRRALLILSVSTHIGVLAYFKYYNFFTDSLAIALSGLGVDINTTSRNVILPVGISFYTFQSMSYAIDVYRREVRATQSVIEYLTFVSFFPQLVAGPIERARDLLPQFGRVRIFEQRAAVTGCHLLLWGFAKKMILADNLGAVVDDVYSRPALASAPELAWATLAFAFQIYADFSGYSDIAAGLGHLFGITLSRNFIYPYFSRSPIEFWRRWHVTLSSWMRDYIFIPLGGSRGTPCLALRSILLTFLISGLWHGADWRFVAWGGLHGLGVAFVHLWRSIRRHSRWPKSLRWSGPESYLMSSTDPAATSNADTLPVTERHSRISAIIQGLLTFTFVCLGWLLFRAHDIGEAVLIFRRLTLGWLDGSAFQAIGSLLHVHGIWMMVLGTFVLVEWLGRRRWNPVAWECLPRTIRWAGYSGVVWMILLFGTKRSTEFVYFQF